MLVKTEARILIFPGTDFHFPSTSVPPGTFFRLWDRQTDGRTDTGPLQRPCPETMRVVSIIFHFRSEKNYNVRTDSIAS